MEHMDRKKQRSKARGYRDQCREDGSGGISEESDCCGI